METGIPATAGTPDFFVEQCVFTQFDPQGRAENRLFARADDALSGQRRDPPAQPAAGQPAARPPPGAGDARTARIENAGERIHLQIGRADPRRPRRRGADPRRPPSTCSRCPTRISTAPTGPSRSSAAPDARAPTGMLIDNIARTLDAGRQRAHHRPAGGEMSRRCAPRRRPLLALALVAPASAERADRDKPTQIDADKQFGDDLKQIVIYTGNVVAHARHPAHHRRAAGVPPGSRRATSTRSSPAAPGQLASFRQTPRQPTRASRNTSKARPNASSTTARSKRCASSSAPTGSASRTARCATNSPATSSPTTAATPPTRPRAAIRARCSGRVRTIIAPRNETPPAQGEPAPLDPARPQ